jgi:Arc/MetJ-type ribon-helix-helix transcriptional regulator
MLANTHYQRFAITIPESMATQISMACKAEGRNRSEFFREAVRYYMGAHNSARSPVFTPPAREMDALSAKDAELAKWAALVESEPVFTDVRAVSSDVNAIAGDALV